VSVEMGFEGSVRVDRYHMRMEGIPKRRTIIPKTRGKSKVDTRLGEEI